MLTLKVITWRIVRTRRTLWLDIALQEVKVLCLLIKFQYAHNGKGCQELCEALIKKCFSIGFMLAWVLIECFFSLSFPGMSRIIAGQLNDIQQFNSKIQQNLHLRLRGHVPSNHQNDRNKPLTAPYSLTKAPPSKPSWQSSRNHANQSVTPRRTALPAFRRQPNGTKTDRQRWRKKAKTTTRPLIITTTMSVFLLLLSQISVEESVPSSYCFLGRRSSRLVNLGV